MTSRDFCYWLQGFLELSPPSDLREGLKAYQVDSIQKHLAMVFKAEIDPSFKPAIRPALNDIHNPLTGRTGERC